MTGPLPVVPEDGGQVAQFDLEEMHGWQVREAVRELLAPGTGVTVEDAVLVIEEMVANAREHGRSPRRCRLELQPGRLRVEVDDSGSGDPRVRTPDLAGGRGMIVIDRLATDWGVIHYEGFKTVWAELPLDRPRFSPLSKAFEPNPRDTRNDS
ncbi:ATP-binding protein [Nocardia sp. NPDC058058]|uniref:ATP-binding protein n=1 Tax=Nocardia sp. NPDC058058 TaxID=3346317 RepID=UPI0036DCBC28